MTNLRAFLVLVGIGCLAAAVSLAAESAGESIRVEAVVTKFEIGAMEDVFDDGFVSYDGVTLRMLSPAELAGKKICVYFRTGSIARSSRLRKSGQRCRFDFDKNHLKSDQLFEGVLEDLEWLDAVAAVNGTDDEPAASPESLKTLEQIENEYSRLLPLWHEERKEFSSSSSTYDYWKGPHGRAIIKLGPAIIPQLIKELRKGDFFFNVPLTLITNVDISNGKLFVSEQEKAKLWIDWWKVQH